MALACGLSLAGCSSVGVQSRIDNYAGNTPAMSARDVNQFVIDQNAILADFASLAGVELPSNGGEWRPVIDAGIHYSDVRCDRFMDSLFWFNRVRETSSRQIQYTGAAASAALAVLEASADAIGLTPLGFTFLDETVNNFGQGLLFNLSPANVRTLVEKRQEAYLRGLSANYTNRAIALQVIQDYAALCLPPSIETEVERAISDQEYEAQPIAMRLPPAADDQIPDRVGFPDKNNQPVSQPVTSAWLRVQGIGSSAPISISGADGEYQIGESGAWTDSDNMVAPDSLVRVRVTSSDQPDTPVSTTLNIGGVAGIFTVRTASAGETPAPLVEEEPPAETTEEAPPGANQLPNPQPED